MKKVGLTGWIIAGFLTSAALFLAVPNEDLRGVSRVFDGVMTGEVHAAESSTVRIEWNDDMP